MLFIVLFLAMSTDDPTSDSMPFITDDSENEGSEDPRMKPVQRDEEEPASGVSNIRATVTVGVLCYINLLNYMDRFTVAGMMGHHKEIIQCQISFSGVLRL